MRNSLPSKLQTHVVLAIEALVEKATTGRLGDPTVLIPKEIRDLLDLMVGTGESAAIAT